MEELDTAITFKDKQGAYQTEIKTKVGDMCNSNFENKDDFADMAISKVVIDTNNEEKKKSWIAALDKAEDKKAPLYLVVDAHTENSEKAALIQYHGDTEVSEIEGQKVKNGWCSKNEKWFMLKGPSRKITHR